MTGVTGGLVLPKCRVRHAESTRESCGHIRQRQYDHPEYRCDRPAGHYGQHHVCGAGWNIEWGIEVPGLVGAAS